jgi:hypothetical protein
MTIHFGPEPYNTIVNKVTQLAMVVMMKLPNISTAGCKPVVRGHERLQGDNQNSSDTAERGG